MTPVCQLAAAPAVITRLWAVGESGVRRRRHTAHYAHSGVAARRPLRALQKDTWLNTGTWHKILESGTVSKESGHVLSPLSQ